MVLLPMGADWCWFQDRKDTPWYANVRLFRQTRAGDWAEVVARVERKLREQGAFTPPRASSPRTAARALACLVNDADHAGEYCAVGACRALAGELEQRGYAVMRVPASGIASLRAGPRDIAEFDDPAVFARVCEANPWLRRALEPAQEVVQVCAGPPFDRFKNLEDSHDGLRLRTFAAARATGQGE